MTDRELLELAAKAARMERHDHHPNHWFSLDRGSYELWNPLQDDGDALRLAVKLGEKYPAAVIGVFNRAAFPHASASVVHRDGTETYVEQGASEDICAATRRAIVRAAAEVGKAS